MSFDEFITKYRNPINFSLFSTLEESRYSCLMPWHVDQVRKVLLTEIKNPKILVDFTAHIGCDTINFSLTFPGSKIRAYEIDQKKADVLKKNILSFKRQNIEVIVKDSTKEEIGEDVSMVYLDPPWGGPGYKDRKDVELFLGDHNVKELIPKYIQKTTVILKAPVNLDPSILRLPESRVKTYSIKTPSGKISFNLHVIRKL